MKKDKICDTPVKPTYKSKKERKGQPQRPHPGKTVETETTPDFQIVVDLTFYPQLRDIVFERARRLRVPPGHVVISLIGEALAAQNGKEL